MSFYGELDIAGAELAAEMLACVPRSTIDLDLSGLTFLDATGVRSILRAKEVIEADGSKLHVRGAFGIVRRVIDLTGLSYLLDD